VTLQFGSHTGNARLTELLYVVMDVWLGIVSLYEFQCFILAQMSYYDMVMMILENSEA